MHRRAMLASSLMASALFLTDCTGASSAVTLNQAKAYFDASVIALLAAAQQYEVGPPMPSAKDQAIVNTITDRLKLLKTSLDAVTVPADFKAGVLEAIALMQQLSPMVAKFLGAAAPYVPLALAVLQAFVASLPPPADAQPVPPVALTNKAMELRH